MRRRFIYICNRLGLGIEVCIKY